MTTPLEIVQQTYAAFGRGDVAAILALCSPQISWQFLADKTAPYTETVVGPHKLGEWFGKVVASDDIHVFEPREMLEGRDHVTVIGFERTTIRATGKTFDSPWIHVFRVENGRIASFWGMVDTQAMAQARAA